MLPSLPITIARHKYCNFKVLTYKAILMSMYHVVGACGQTNSTLAVGRTPNLASSYFAKDTNVNSTEHGVGACGQTNSTLAVGLAPNLASSYFAKDTDVKSTNVLDRTDAPDST